MVTKNDEEKSDPRSQPSTPSGVGDLAAQTPMVRTSEKPKILVACVPLHSGRGRVRGSTPGGDVMGCAMTEAGDVLGEHLSSSESYCEHDMGITSDWKHEQYAAHFPDGYDLVWLGIGYKDDPRWQAAIAKNHARFPPDQPDVDEVTV